jgi:hypothetical protein
MPGSPKLAQFLCDWFGKVVNQPVVQPEPKSNPPEGGQGNKVARQINPLEPINLLEFRDAVCKLAHIDET